MEVTGFLFGTVLVALGATGWVVTSRINGNPLGGAVRRTGAPDVAGGFDAETAATATTEASVPFTYEGKIDHATGAKRRLLAIVWLILLIGAVGVAIAGSIWLLIKVIVAQLIEFGG
ncbi:MAG: hypothetical protein WD004_04960 [Actinomycetota bacterium]